MLNDSNLKEPKETLDIVSDLDDDETILAEEAARDEEAKKKEEEKAPKDFRNSIYANVDVKVETMDKIILWLVILLVFFIILGGFMTAK
ncbi:MAG: hypothetical protein UIM26_06700 [Longicatena sp.]|nr:hypothetical protein [Longicatena sp.]